MKKLALLFLLVSTVVVGQNPLLNKLPSNNIGIKGFIQGSPAPYFIKSLEQAETTQLPNGIEFELLNTKILDSNYNYFCKVKITDPTAQPMFKNLVCFINPSFSSLVNYIDYNTMVIDTKPYYYEFRKDFKPTKPLLAKSIAITIKNDYGPFGFFNGNDFSVYQKLPNGTTAEMLSNGYEKIDGDLFVMAKITSSPNKELNNKIGWVSVYDIDLPLDLRIDYDNKYAYNPSANRFNIGNDNCNYTSVVYPEAGYYNTKNEYINGASDVYDTQFKERFYVTAKSKLLLLNKKIFILKGLDRYLKVRVINDSINPTNNGKEGFITLVNTDFFDYVNDETMEIDTTVKRMYDGDYDGANFLPEPILENKTTGITGAIQSEFGDGYLRVVGDTTFMSYYIPNETTFDLLSTTIYDDGVYYLAKVRITSDIADPTLTFLKGKDAWVNIDETTLIDRADFDALLIK